MYDKEKELRPLDELSLPGLRTLRVVGGGWQGAGSYPTGLQHALGHGFVLRHTTTRTASLCKKTSPTLVRAARRRQTEKI